MGVERQKKMGEEIRFLRYPKREQQDQIYNIKSRLKATWGENRTEYESKRHIVETMTEKTKDMKI